MDNIDYLNEERYERLPIGGNRPLLLDDPGSVYIVEQGKISVFLVNLTADNKPGGKKFLFYAEQGDMLFGITPEDVSGKKGFQAAGLEGTAIIRLNINRIEKLLHGENEKEVISSVVSWLRTVEFIHSETIYKQEQTLQPTIKPREYISDPLQRELYNSQILRSITRLYEEEKQNEQKRLQEKKDTDERLMVNAIAGLSSLFQEKKAIDLEESSGDHLLDACRLVGRHMNIDIVSPPIYIDRNRVKRAISLEDIARASRVRTRKVSLQGQWYNEDNGPILGYMKEDDRPVALIPDSPSKYIVNDAAYGNTEVVDRKTVSHIKPYGYIMYRPFENRKINWLDLLKFGFESCWKRDLSLIILMGIVGGILGLAIPVATGIVFDTIIPQAEKGQLLQIVFFLGAAAVSSMLLQFIRSVAALRLEGKMDGSLQAAIWDRVLSLPVPFFRGFSSGELAMRAMGINRMRAILSGTTLNTILSGLFSVFNVALLFYYDPRLAGIAIVLVLLAILFIGYISSRQVKYERKVLEISNKISGFLIQLIGGVTKFRVAGAEKRVFYHWTQEFKEQRKQSFKNETIGNVLTTFNAFFPVLSSMVIFYALISHASLAPGQFIAFNTAFINFMIALISISESLMNINLIVPLYQRAKPILDTLPEYDETKITPNPLTGSIEVSHVSFRYVKEGPYILQDISLQIDRGDYVALVGPSGSGKSTLFRILLGFEEPETGKVYYDDQDLSKVDIRLVRQQLGVVLQNGQLMSGTIFSNMIGAKPNLTIDDAWKAARMVGIEEDIKEMPMGMYTMISEGASTISGGQKQRLLIARAIVNNPEIIFFDEATSALDNRTQSIVSESLDRLEVTRVVIAHRLSTIINCNKIFVMDRGKIVERGNYDELMKKGGVFAELSKRQLA